MSISSPFFLISHKSLREGSARFRIFPIMIVVVGDGGGEGMGYLSSFDSDVVNAVCDIFVFRVVPPSAPRERLMYPFSIRTSRYRQGFYFLPSWNEEKENSVVPIENFSLRNMSLLPIQ